METHLRELNAHFADGRPWVLGEEFTLADASLMPILHRLELAQWSAPLWEGKGWQHFEGYLARLKERPSYQVRSTPSDACWVLFCFALFWKGSVLFATSVVVDAEHIMHPL